MELSNKEVDLQRNKLLQVSINLESDYLPMLHAQAAELRKDTILLDEYLTKDLSGLQAELSKLITYLDNKPINELKEAIANATYVGQKRMMEHTLKTMEERYLDKTKTFTQDFLGVIRKIHHQNNLLASSNLYKQCQKAYEHKEQELSDHLQYIENTLVPQLNAVKKVIYDKMTEVTELEQKIEAEKAVYDTLKTHLESIKDLYTVCSISQYFLRLSENIFRDLNQYYEQVNTKTQTLDELLAHAQNLLKYLESLNIIRK